MPKQPRLSSTDRRKELADKIDLVGSEMPVACSECRKHKRTCLVHTSSGRCNHCNRHNSVCDVRVTEAEWSKLKSAREVLLSRLAEAREATSLAIAKEQRLMKQLALVDRRAATAISIGEREAQEAEVEEVLSLEAVLPAGSSSLSGSSMSLSPFTWAATDGLDDAFFENLGSAPPWPVFDGSPGAVAGSSSGS